MSPVICTNLQDAVKYVRSQTDTIVLWFSRGIDSVTAWLYLRDHFHVVPVHCVYIPGIRWIEDDLSYYEKMFGTKIHRVLGDALPADCLKGVFQTPRSYLRANRSALPRRRLNVPNLWRSLGLPPRTTWVASGERAAESIFRQQWAKKRGYVDVERRIFYPNLYRKRAEERDMIRNAGMREATDYDMFRRTFVGPAFKYLREVRVRHPLDYEQIEAYYPLVEAEFFRFEVLTKPCQM